MASLLYWWAQRGYPRLVEDHLTAAGQQSWRSFVEELHDDYLDGACIPAWLGGGVSQYLVTQDELEKELKQYVVDHGAFASVSHYRVCDGCNLNDDNDRSKSGGLQIIQDQLEAGRPLILGFASNRADESSDFVDGESILTGELSNGAGWIDHYAVITGYRRTSDGRDVIYINNGSDNSAPDVALQWNPSGKWTHLFTLSISSTASPAQFCSLDQPISTMFSSYVDVETSHATRNTSSSTREFTVMAGTGCGKAQDGVWRPVTTHTADYCPTRPLVDYTDDVSAAGPLDQGNQPLDQLGPM
jgi:hypothetical protein